MKVNPPPKLAISRAKLPNRSVKFLGFETHRDHGVEKSTPGNLSRCRSNGRIEEQSSKCLEGSSINLKCFLVICYVTIFCSGRLELIVMLL